MCELLYTRTEYKGKVIFIQEMLSNEPVETHRGSVASLSIWPEYLREPIRPPVFICKEFKIDKSFLYYKLMAGPGIDSLILFKPSRRSHKAIEWVKNIYFYNSLHIDQNY